MTPNFKLWKSAPVTIRARLAEIGGMAELTDEVRVRTWTP